MAPRGGGGGGRGGGTGGGGGGSISRGGSGEPIEQQTYVSSLYGRAHSTPFTDEEIMGATIVNALYAIVLLICFFVMKDSQNPQRPATKKIRISWIRVLVWTILLGVVGFGLEAARWGLLIEGGTRAGRSWRFGEAVGEVFMGAWEVLMVAVVFRLCGLVLGGLVPKSGPDPELARLRKWVDRASVAILGLLTACIIAEVGLGFELANGALGEWGRSGVWRLGDREFSTMMSEKRATVEVLANVYGDNVTPTEIWDSLVQRFIPADGSQDWTALRMAQLGLEYTRTCLIFGMLLFLGSIAYAKRSISNPHHTGSKGMIVRLSTTIIRGFLYIVLPTLLLSTLTHLLTLSTLVLPNTLCLSHPTSWSTLRASASGWIDGYRFAFEDFQLFYALLKPLGWVVLAVMLTVLSRMLVRMKTREYKAEETKRVSQSAQIPYAIVGGEGDEGRKEKSNSMWRRILRAF